MGGTSRVGGPLSPPHISSRKDSWEQTNEGLWKRLLKGLEMMPMEAQVCKRQRVPGGCRGKKTLAVQSS